MSDEHRAALLELAARRGLKGFSSLVEDAITGYLAAEASRDDKRRAAVALRGVLTWREAKDVRERVTHIRWERG
jgi:metal-responsive CopG/Arc/MetJ family transcriptional regulator